MSKWIAVVIVALCFCLLAACGKQAPTMGSDPRVDQASTGIRYTEKPRKALTGEQLFMVCTGCHSLEADAPDKVGPNLYGLRGRKAGTRAGFAYSGALNAAGESWLTWEKGTLIGFITNSEAMVPDTWMQFYPTLSVEETWTLADYILEQGTATEELP